MSDEGGEQLRIPLVGCSGVDITLEPGLPMVGMPGSPHSEAVQWPLRSRVFLVDDGERRIVVVCLDLIALMAGHVAELSERLAVPADRDPTNILYTLVATLTNGWHGYVPTLEAFARGGYEPRFAYPSRVAPEAGDRMTNAALELLRRLSSWGHGSPRWTMAPAPDSS